ncbi:DNA repair protein [Hysterangium stoloniferum]|nr:DNA repair protein [Hysterangium stoloniferum]
MALEAEIRELQTKLGEGEDAEKIVNGYIKLLHQYNEAKDATQLLIGKLAAIRQVTVRELHEDYGLTIDD